MKELCINEMSCENCPNWGTCNKEKQSELFHELFTKYGTYEEVTSDKRINLWLMHPNKIETDAEVIKRLNEADKDIQRLEHYINMMKAYKIELTKRYNYILTAPTKEKILLERCKKYNGKVFYYIRFYTVNLEDGKHILKDTIVYEGSKRSEAIKKYESLKAEYKNADFEKDINKKSWEK